MEAERADKAGAADAAAAAAGGLPDAAPSPRDVRRVMMRGRKAAAWRHLTLPERDALTVLTAICKVMRIMVVRIRFRSMGATARGRGLPRGGPARMSAWHAVSMILSSGAGTAHTHTGSHICSHM